MLALWGPLLLLVAAADAGAADHPPATPEVKARQTLQTSSVYGAAEFRDVVSGASTTGTPRPARAQPQEEPATQVEIREPDPSFDAGVRGDSRTAARSDPPPAPSPPVPTADATGQALLEQSKAQTETMQALLAQQQAQEQARQAEQQARTDRAAAVQDVRDTIGGTIQTLATSGNYDSSSLSQASASLRKTAASATASGSVGEATRANEAASMLDAAKDALTQRNAQQAQWYLTRAAVLLGEQQQGRGGY